ncbi:MAG: cobalamin-dependent protein [Hyphomonadaceae bacterium]|nr:cobalamin-dependent protein [Hyphomonadaceae bacterium]
MPSLYVKDINMFAGGGRRTASREVADSQGSAAAYADGAEDLAVSKGDCVDLLARMVEGEIIPRLLLAHQATGRAPPPASEEPSFTPATADEFAQLVLSSSVDSLIDYVDLLLRRGASIQSIYMDLLAPTARRLGEYWNSDYCSFADVTIGLGKLQQILHELSRRQTRSLDSDRPGRSALFAVAPGDQHTFGLLVIEEFFRRAGWRTWCEPRGTAEDLAQMVGGQWYDLFGLSVSSESHLDQVTAIITSVRRCSKNKAIRIMVGGRVFTENPELVARVGADATASDGTQAVTVAEGAVRQLEGRC